MAANHWEAWKAIVGTFLPPLLTLRHLQELHPELGYNRVRELGKQLSRGRNNGRILVSSNDYVRWWAEKGDIPCGRQ